MAYVATYRKKSNLIVEAISKTMIPIQGKTNEDAWLKAVKHFIDNDKNLEYNLILEIDQPTATDERSKAIRKELDDLLKGSNDNLYTINTVAETIFPAAEYKKHGIKGVMEYYPDIIYPQIKCSSDNSKGTYALRLVRGIDAKGNKCNPLKNVLERLGSQLKRNNNAIRCAYELPLDDVETIAINRNDKSIMGFPCLSHLSFKLNEDRSKIILTALYRSQDYTQKALGNLRGLARLQSFLARELGISVGPLVCHSTYARLDTHSNLGRSKIISLINNIEDKYNGSI